MLLCILGSTIIVLHGPTTEPTVTLPAFFAQVFAPGFISFTIIVALIFGYFVMRLGPRYGRVNPTVYVTMTSICGAYLVNAAQGFGSSVLYSFAHWETDNQFRYWGLYPLAAFITVAIVFQIAYLNKALSNFSASIVTPLNFVFFSTATLITSAVLYQGFNVTSGITSATIVIGFIVIILGVGLIFQYNLKLNKIALTLDRVEEPEELDEDPLAEQDPISLFQESFLANGSIRSRTFRSAQELIKQDEEIALQDSVLKRAISEPPVRQGFIHKITNDQNKPEEAHPSNGDTTLDSIRLT